MTTLLYSLPIECPLPWPIQPNYPFTIKFNSNEDITVAYSDSLLSFNTPKSTLDAFTRLLLSHASDPPSSSLPPLLRTLILPLHDFDHKWRTIVPAIINPTPPEIKEKDLSRVKLTQRERDGLQAFFVAWKIKAEEKLKSDKSKAVDKSASAVKAEDSSGASKPSPREEEGSASMQVDVVVVEEKDKPAAWTVQEVDVSEWLNERELFETCLQALVLLALLSLPPPPLTSPPVKVKRKKDPERHASTLDPELLLDFLTDRLQIWRVMKDVSDMGLGAQPQGAESVEEELDEVQVWWNEVVEAHFTPLLPATLLKHHHTKLFPSATPSDALAVRLAPAPSPFKDRSLLSLDKSARRKEWKEGQKSIAESPTMKRLSKGVGVPRKSRGGEEEEVFKVPLMPKRTVVEPTDSTSTSTSTTAAAPARTRPPRKQERPRPLPRGDSLAGSSKGLFNRREVSLSRKPSGGVGLKKKKQEKEKEKEEAEKKLAEGRKRKRKSLSPKKLSSATTSATLVPDTPVKPHSVARAPSFAALGAAFRPGASAVDPFASLPFDIPSPPLLPGDRRRGGMDWEEEDEEDERFLEGREEDVRRELSGGGTPVSKRSWVIPDT